MSNEILSILEYMEKEKGISRTEMIETITNAIKNAALRGVNAGQDLKIEINPKNGHLKAWSSLKVVDSVSDHKIEIPLEKARQQEENVQLGETIYQEIEPSFLGRIAAQTARQSIMQRLHQFEKERIYDDYKDSVGDIVSGIVRRKERNNLVVDLGKAEAIFPGKEQIPGEDYSANERIRCLLLAIEPTNHGPELILSRANVSFVRRLLELEVNEIKDGTVTLESISREAGYRTKIAVNTKEAKIDPVGSCVGARGVRVKSIVRELGGEKVDIIRYYDDPLQMLKEAIKPAIAHNVNVDKSQRRISFQVNEEHLSVAIGRRGQNARLTSKLMGWKLDISKLETINVGFDDRIKAAIAGWHGVPGINAETAKKLVDMGIINPEAFMSVEENDLIGSGFTKEEACYVINQLNQYHSNKEKIS